MKAFLITLSLAVLTIMLYATMSASLQQDLVTATRQLWPDLWFVLIMALGNLAMASYLLLQIPRLQPGDGIDTLLRQGGS